MTAKITKKEYGIRRGLYIPPALDKTLNELREETGVKSRNSLIVQLINIGLEELERVREAGGVDALAEKRATGEAK